jgi:hypothetical protein
MLLYKQIILYIYSFIGGISSFMIDYVEFSPMVVELLMFIIEKQRTELTRLVEKNDYNFQSNEVIAASIEMDHWLNFYQLSCPKNKASRRHKPS